MDVTKTTLANGLTVITDYMPQFNSTTVGCWLAIGSRDENSSKNGISHMLEHMVFKGTTRRTSRQIVEQIEDVGGDINAATGMEMTGFFAETLYDDIELAVEIIADIIINPTLNNDDLESEKQVILQEIAEAYDSPDDWVFELLQQATFAKQELGRPILGSNSTVKQMSNQDLQTYHRNNYKAGSMIVSAAGNIEHNKFVAIAEKYFGKISKGKVIKKRKSIYKGGVKLQKRSLEQTHIAIAFPAFSYFNADYYNLKVLSIILGEGMSSRLFQEIREKKGLCYSIFSFINTYEDTGILGIYSSVANNNVIALLKEINYELKKCSTNIDGKEVKRAKAQLRAGILMEIEHPSSRSDQLARQQIMFGENFTTEQLLDKIDQVNTRQIMELAKSIFARKSSLAAIGQIDQLKDIKFDKL